jgi:tetratricopeptide (TPR) repeat protein
MKKYRNVEYGFEIKIPEEWSLHGGDRIEHVPGKSPTIIFRCRPSEAFNVQITPLAQKPSLYQIDYELKRFAKDKGYTSHETGRITIDGQEHIWSRYYQGGGLWSKKYLVIFNGFEYMLTATCLEQKRLVEMEKAWDDVAISFQKIKDNTTENNIPEQKSKLPSKSVADQNNSKTDDLTKENIRGVKTYRNDELGIEVDVPGNWSLPEKDPLITKNGTEIIFGCGTNEAFYITIKASFFRLSPEEIKTKFREYAQNKGYSHLELGKFSLFEDDHVWVRYYLGDNIWIKKYLIFLDKTQYEITASCTEPDGKRDMFDRKEKDWDLIVKLFRVQSHPSKVLKEKIKVDKPLENNEVQPVKDSRRNEEIPMPVSGMKTYRNEKHGFEIDIPETWSPVSPFTYKLTGVLYAQNPPGVKKDCFQYGNYDEAFNFEIGSLFPEPLLEDTEIEFKLYARNMGFMDLHFGRVTVMDKEHVCAHYFINDNMGRRWNKKYMIVFGGTEYTITGTCNDPQYFTKREKGWDAIIQSFRLLKPVDDSANLTDKAEMARRQRREVIQQRISMRETMGELYSRGYEAALLGQFKEARTLLEKCLQDNPDHMLAHKELAVILEKLDDIKGAIYHREEVRRLAPDDAGNRARLDKLLVGSGRSSHALQDVKKALKITPKHPVLLDVEKMLKKTQSPNYRTIFFSSLICLILTDISFFFPEYITIGNTGCMSLLLLMPTWGVWTSGHWVGVPKKISGLIAGTLYLFFLINAW